MPMRSIISPVRSCSSAFSAKKSMIFWPSSTSFARSSSVSSFMNGITTVPIRSPIFSVRLPPTRIVAPLSLPGASAPVITLMQCMQRTQSRLSIARPCVSESATVDTVGPGWRSFSSFSWIVRVGQRAMTSLTSSFMPCFANHFFASSSSVRMLSRQVPITAMSARWIEFMQSFGQPENLNLNL